MKSRWKSLDLQIGFRSYLESIANNGEWQASKLDQGIYITMYRCIRAFQFQRSIQMNIAHPSLSFPNLLFKSLIHPFLLPFLPLTIFSQYNYCMSTPMSSTGFHVSSDSLNRQLFLPEQLQSIRLGQLRQRRRELEDKLRLVSNRITFRKKKEEQDLRRYIRSQERTRMLSETKNYKRFQEMLKEEVDQKKQFEIQKKAREVEQYRASHSRRIQLIHQAVKERKQLQSQKIRRSKRTDLQILTSAKHNSQLQARQRHEQIQRMKQRQLQKKKHYWFVQKRLTFQQNMIEQAQIYQKQIQQYYKQIEELKQHEEELRVKEEHASQVLRCAEQNYELLKKA